MAVETIGKGSGRGGRRTGAGRKPGTLTVDPEKKVTQEMVSLPRELWDYIALFKDGYEAGDDNAVNASIKNMVAMTKRFYPRGPGSSVARERRAEGRKTKDEERAAAVAYVIAGAKEAGLDHAEITDKVALGMLRTLTQDAAGEARLAYLWYRDITKAQKGKFLADLTKAAF